jgi:hypothetical protein
MVKATPVALIAVNLRKMRVILRELKLHEPNVSYAQDTGILSVSYKPSVNSKRSQIYTTHCLPKTIEIAFNNLLGEIKINMKKD